MKLIEALRKHLTDDEIGFVNKRFEIIGDIAIIEVPEEIEDKRHIIAETLKDLNKHVNIVLRKTGDVSGKYRIGKYEILIGDRTDTICRENGCRFKVDPARVYFSSKMGYERGRVTEDVKDGEKILCMFAGIGPYPINIAKRKDVSITAIEINPDAVEVFRENMRLNKVEDRIDVILGDVADILPKIKGKFDRVLMPAPKDAENYLDIALEKAKKGGIINIYSFRTKEKLDSFGKAIEKRCAELGYKIKVTGTRDCGNVGPYCYRVVCDFRVL